MLPKYLSALLSCLGFYLCGFIALRRSMHMYQLNSYQSFSYKHFLQQNPGEMMSARRTAPLLLTFLASVFSYGLLPAWLLYPLANRYPPAKKPLVATPRVRRMAVTAAIVSLPLGVGLCLLAFYGARLRWSIRIPLALAPWIWILLQPRLVMLYNLINSPVEGWISRGFVRDAARILASHPRLTVIGITGSYGKTSLKYYLYELLNVQHNVYMTPGNYNTTLGVVRAIREGLRPTHEIFLCEMGARHPGDIKEICDLVHPHLGVITAIGEQHLETFGSQETITRTKLELADAVAGDGRLFYSIDSPILAGQVFQGQSIAYGMGEDAAYRVTGWQTGSRGSSFTLTTPQGESQTFKTRLLGSANLQNLCGALAVAHTLGTPLIKLVPAVQTLKSAPHRLELKRGDGMMLIDDAYNANPQGAQVALETLAQFSGTRIALTPGMVELGSREQALNEALGRQAAACCDWLVTVGSSPGGYVAAGAKAAGMEHVFEAQSIQEALAWARGLDAPEKTVLLLNDLPDTYH